MASKHSCVTFTCFFKQMRWYSISKVSCIHGQQSMKAPKVRAYCTDAVRITSPLAKMPFELQALFQICLLNYRRSCKDAFLITRALAKMPFALQDLLQRCLLNYMTSFPIAGSLEQMLFELHAHLHRCHCICWPSWKHTVDSYLHTHSYTIHCLLSPLKAVYILFLFHSCPRCPLPT
jgi:hypothetical protein